MAFQKNGESCVCVCYMHMYPESLSSGGAMWGEPESFLRRRPDLSASNVSYQKTSWGNLALPQPTDELLVLHSPPLNSVFRVPNYFSVSKRDLKTI